MDRQEWIGKKIALLKKQGKSNQESLIIALAAWENMPKAQMGGVKDMYGNESFSIPPLMQFPQPNYDNQGININPNDESNGMTNPKSMPSQQQLYSNQYYNTMSDNYDENGNAVNTGERKIVDNRESQIFNPYGGVDLGGALSFAGQGFGSGNYGQAAVGTGLSLLKGARNFLSGFSSAKASKEAYDSAKEAQFRKNTNPSYQQEGGQMPPPQEGQNQMQQIMQMIMQSLQQGMSPEQVIQQLVQAGVPQEQAQMLLQEVMAQSQQQPAPQEQGQMMQEGGYQKQKFATNKGYGNQVQDVNNTISANPWYFNNNNVNQNFINAARTNGSHQEVLDFQNAYNTQLKTNLGSSNLSEEERNKVYNDSAFTGYGKRALDGKFGDFTSAVTMPTFSQSTATQNAPQATQPTAKYYSIKDTNHQKFGGGQTTYRVRDLKELAELPKELWDREIVPHYQEGGTATNADMMTGAYIAEDAPQDANIEIEKGEYVFNSQTGEIKKGEGERHTNGGIKVDLPKGSMILSNYTKVGAKTAKEMSDKFSIKANATDTFSQVMDKVNRKIGYFKLLDEEKEQLKKVEKTDKLETNKATQDLNADFLGKQLQEIEQKKSELLKDQQTYFQELFTEQESREKKGNGTEILKKEGGSVYNPAVLAMAKKYSLPVNKVSQIMQQGGFSPQNYKKMTYADGTTDYIRPTGGTTNGFNNNQKVIKDIRYNVSTNGVREGSLPDTKPYTRVEYVDGTFDYVKTNAEEENMFKRMPNYVNYMQKLGAKNNPPVQPNNGMAFIQNAQPMMQEGGIPMAQEGVTTDRRKPFYDFSTKYTPQIKGYDVQGQSILNEDNLKGVEEFQAYKEGRGYGNKMQDANRTAELHSWYFDTPEKKQNFIEATKKQGSQPEVVAFQKAYNDEIKKRAEAVGVDSKEISSIVNKLGFSGQGVQKPDGLFGAFSSTRPLVNFKKAPNQEIIIEETPTTPADNTITLEGTKYTMPPLLPQDINLPPSALQNIYKGEIRFGEVDPIKISPEAKLREIERQRQSVANNSYFLGDSERAALMASSLGQSQALANEAIEIYNAQSQQQADQFNLQNQMKEDLTNQELNMSFEKRNLAGQAMYENNLRSYFNELNNQNRANFNYIDRRNILNQSTDNYKNDGSSIGFYSDGTQIQNNRNPTQGMTAKQIEIYDKELAINLARNAAKRTAKK